MYALPRLPPPPPPLLTPFLPLARKRSLADRLNNWFGGVDGAADVLVGHQFSDWDGVGVDEVSLIGSFGPEDGAGGIAAEYGVGLEEKRGQIWAEG